MSGSDLSDALSDMWRSVLLFVPTALAFLAILLIGYVLARLVRTVVVKTLRRIGFDRAVERGAIGKALGGRAEPSDLCAKIAFYAVLLFALQLAFGIWGPNAVSDLLTALIGWLPRAFVAIVIIVVAAAIGGAVRDLIGSALGGLAYGRVLAQVAYWLIVALGIIAALDQVQIATAVTQPVLIAVLATVAGVLIVGVGGGLVRPMQRRWETWLDRASAESATIREHARSYADERARAAAEKKAAEEEAAQAAAAQEAEQARLAEQARVDEAERKAREAAAAEADRVEAERAAEEAERQRLLAAAAAEKTQVIPVQRPWPGSDDQPHVVPGFDEPAGTDAAETTAWLRDEPAAGSRSSKPMGEEDAAAHTEPESVAHTEPESVAHTEPESAEPKTAESGAVGPGAAGVGSAEQQPDAGAGADRDPAGGAVSARSDTVSSSAGTVSSGADTASSSSSSSSRGDVAGTAVDGAEPTGDEAETTTDVMGQGGGAKALGDQDSDTTVTISQSDRRRHVLPQQGGPADGEKTQVIRTQPDEGTKA